MLICVLAKEPLCVSQVSIQMIAISDLGETLTTLGLDVIQILLKIWVVLIICYNLRYKCYG